MKYVFILFYFFIIPIINCLIEITNGTFDKIYLKNASNELNHIFIYSYDHIKYQKYAVRVYIKSRNSTLKYPLFCVIRKENNIISWQVPLKLSNNRLYHSVSRTLCSDAKNGSKPVPGGPTGGNFSDYLGGSHSRYSRSFVWHHGEEDTIRGELKFMVEITSFSPSPTEFSILLTLEDGYLLNTGQSIQFTASPSQPVYFLYLFPPNLTSVRILATSSDKLCGILSIQSIPCPVFDIDENVRFEGLYQTMTTKAAISISRPNYQYEGFFVVFVIKSTDDECVGGSKRNAIPSPFHPNLVFSDFNDKGDNRSNRVKIISLRITESLSRVAYLKATLIPLGIFLFLYLVTFIFTFGYYIKDKRREFDSWLVEEPGSRLSPKPSRPLLTTIPNTYDSANQTKTHNLPTTSHPQHTPRADVGCVSSVEDSSFSSGAEEREFSDLLTVSSDSSESSATRSKKRNRSPPNGNSRFYYGTSKRCGGETINNDSCRDIGYRDTLTVADLSRKRRKMLYKKYILYHWNLFPIAIFYMLPVVQLVFTYEKIIDMTGNQDLCYYNFMCAHPLGNLLSFNNIYSNLGYVMLGVLFFGLVWRRDMIQRKTLILNGSIEKYYGIPNHFGLFYAMAIALVIEGLLSACYHVCPNYSNFQFDTSFMYIITGLTMLKIYQTRHPDISASSYFAYFAFAIIVVISVVGVVEGNDWFWATFSIGLCVGCLVLSLQIYYMGDWKLDTNILTRTFTFWVREVPNNPFPKYPDRLTLLVLANLINVGMVIYGLCERPKNFPAYLLGILIFDLLLYLAFYIIMKIRYRERIRIYTIVFIILASFVWASALYFFLHGNISWQMTPAESREKNGKCVLLEFYDIHDVWHFLSALALFFSFMTLLTLDDDLIRVRRDQIPVF